MPPQNLRSAVEALLFSSDQPLPLALLADALDSDSEAVTGALEALGNEYRARQAGVELREMAGGWIVTSTSDQHEWVTRMLRGKRKMRLSRAALETLAIIAYKQPVTKSEVEAIRGVDSSGTLATLLERSLVTIKGRSTVVGRPLLYGSTPEFLNYFGLRDLNELPRPEELRALVAAREPEQMEMIELDGDGMPLAIAAAANALAAAEGGEAAGELAAPSEAELEDEAVSEADAALLDGSLSEDDADESDDEDEFEDDDDDEYDEDDDADDDDDDDEDGVIDDLDDDTDEIEDDDEEPMLDEEAVEEDALLVSGDTEAASDSDDDDSDDEDEYDDDDEFEDDDDEDDDEDGDDDDDQPSARLSERDGR